MSTALSLSPTQHPAALAGWRRSRFEARGRILFIARLMLFSLVALSLAMPGIATRLGIEPAAAWPILGGLALAAIGARLVLTHPRLGPAAASLSLCFEGAVVAAAAASSGGLFSPLLSSALLVAVASALVLRPLQALLPALAPLPLAAWLGAPGAPGATELFLASWYGLLLCGAVGALAILGMREERLQRALLALQTERATDEERRRLAREMHDGVGASLAALTMQAELVESDAPPELSATIAELRESAAEATDELRRSLKALRGDFDPAAAAAELCRTFSARRGLPLRFRMEGALPPLASGSSLAIVRVLQECLTNTARHARASSVDVTLACNEGGVRITIRDDGAGFDPATAGATRYGLRGMRERAAALGGTIEIDSAPGSGTRVELFLPRSSEAT